MNTDDHNHGDELSPIIARVAPNNTSAERETLSNRSHITKISSTGPIHDGDRVNSSPVTTLPENNPVDNKASIAKTVVTRPLETMRGKNNLVSGRVPSLKRRRELQRDRDEAKYSPDTASSSPCGFIIPQLDGAGDAMPTDNTGNQVGTPQEVFPGVDSSQLRSRLQPPVVWDGVDRSHIWSSTVRKDEGKDEAALPDDYVIGSSLIPGKTSVGNPPVASVPLASPASEVVLFERDHDSLSCEWCHKAFNTKQGLGKHKKTCTARTGTGPTAKFCPPVSPPLRAIVRESPPSGQLVVGGEVAAESSNNWSNCASCGQSFANRYAFSAHFRSSLLNCKLNNARIEAERLGLPPPNDAGQQPTITH